MFSLYFKIYFKNQINHIIHCCNYLFVYYNKEFHNNFEQKN